MHLTANTAALAEVLLPASKLSDEVIVKPQPGALRICGHDKFSSETVWTTADPAIFSTYKPQCSRFGLDLTTTLPMIQMTASSQLSVTTPPHSDRISISSPTITYQADALDPETIPSREYSTVVESGQTTFTVPRESRRVKCALSMANWCARIITVQTHSTSTDPVVELTAQGDTDEVYAPFSDDHFVSSTVSNHAHRYSLEQLSEMYTALVTHLRDRVFMITESGMLSVSGEHSQTGINTQYQIPSHGNMHARSTTKSQ